MEAEVLIVGCGQAGAQLATNLRQRGYKGSIMMIGDEPDFPYARPPLSKTYLAGEWDAARLVLRPPASWAQRNIDVRLGQRIVEVDAQRRMATTQEGRVIRYGRLVWAAGGRPRQLSVPGSDLGGIHSIRTRADVDRLRSELANAHSIVIVGGGYIGLETAAVLATSGKKVTVLEREDRVLARVTSSLVSRVFETEHRARHVDIRIGTGVSSFVGSNGRVAHVVLESGERLESHVVIVGIGLIPSIEVLARAGAACGNGIEVDSMCRTTLPDIFAIGDCAARVSEFADGARVRLESVANAVEHAGIAAAALLDQPVPACSVPWFWSNQYDLRFQAAGLYSGSDEVFVRGDPSSRSFSVLYLRGGRVAAIDCINATKDFVAGKSLVERRATLAEAGLTESSVA